MRNSIKLLATVSTLLSANVFAAGAEQGTAESHVLSLSKFTESRNALSQIQGAEYPGACYEIGATCKWHDEATYKIFEEIQDGFTRTASTLFPKANFTSYELGESHLFSDTSVGKYQPDSFKKAKEIILNTLKPFHADLDVMLCVTYSDTEGEKKVLFIPNSLGQEESIKSLRSENVDARPISKLKEFIPSDGFEGRRILDSKLMLSLGTHGLLSKMVKDLSASFEREGLGSIVLGSESPAIGAVPVVAMKSQTYMDPQSAEVIETVLNSAAEKFRDDDGLTRKYNLDYPGLRVYLGVHNIIAGEFTRY